MLLMEIDRRAKSVVVIVAAAVVVDSVLDSVVKESETAVVVVDSVVAGPRLLDLDSGAAVVGLLREKGIHCNRLCQGLWQYYEECSDS